MAPPLQQQVKVPPRRTANDMIADLVQNQTRQDNRTRWMLRLGQFQDNVSARAESWQTAALNIGSAYKNAATMHKATLDKQSSSDALNNQILFSILTVATVGAVSWVSSAIQSRVGNALRQAGKTAEYIDPRLALIEAVEDVAKTGTGAVVGNVLPVVYAPNRKPLDQDPQVYQNDLVNSVSAVKKEVFMAFGRIKNAASTAPLEAWDDYDERQQLAEHKRWQDMAKKLAGDEALPTVSQMADELERGIWQRYVLESHSYRDFGLFTTRDTYDFVGYHVYRRLADLKVVTMPQIGGDDLPEGMMDPALIGPNQDFIDIPVAWAKKYQVKDLVAYGKALRGS